MIEVCACAIVAVIVSVGCVMAVAEASIDAVVVSA
jgi:hypothetical protein